MSWNTKWVKGIDYPSWGDNDVYKKTIAGGYLINGESPREAYTRVAKTVAKRLYKPELEKRFFEHISSFISGIVNAFKLDSSNITT